MFWPYEFTSIVMYSKKSNSIHPSAGWYCQKAFKYIPPREVVPPKLLNYTISMGCISNKCKKTSPTWMYSQKTTRLHHMIGMYVKIPIQNLTFLPKCVMKQAKKSVYITLTQAVCGAGSKKFIYLTRSLQMR